MTTPAQNIRALAEKAAWEVTEAYVFPKAAEERTAIILRFLSSALKEARAVETLTHIADNEPGNPDDYANALLTTLREIERMGQTEGKL